MNLNLLKFIKEQLETSLVNKKLSTISDNEKEKINKIINFALSWWLIDVYSEYKKNNCKDKNIDSFYSFIKSQPLTENDILQLENFKYVFGISTLKRLLLSDGNIELHCGYEPDGLLGKIVDKSKCKFLELYLPNKSTMYINKQEVWLRDGYGCKKCLVFDANKEKQDYQVDYEEIESLSPKEKEDRLLELIDRACEKWTNNEAVIPYNFTPSDYDFISYYIDSTKKDTKTIKKYTR